MRHEGGSDTILVIGGGIVGVTVAAHLAETGRHVTLVDRKGIALEASYGNAAALAFSDILPMASPGIMKKVPRWLFDPVGPLTIRPSYLPKIAPWLYLFWRASSRRQYEESTRAQSAMMALGRQESVAFYERIGAGGMVRHDGSLELYQSDAEFKESLEGWEACGRAGISYHHLNGREIADYQPGLSPDFVAATFVPEWKTVSEPHELARTVWRHAEARGAVYRQGEVVRLARNPSGRAEAVMKGGGTIAADRIVIAAGAWSHRLVRSISRLSIPLETERGYNTTLPSGAADIRRQLIFPGHGFVITPLATGVRVGGAVELAGLDLPPNFARSKAMLAKAKRFLPDLNTEGGTEWMGFRPSLPDTKPAIGPLPADGDIICAFGHGHLGLTQSVATALIVKALVEDVRPPIDLAPYRPDRF